MSSSLLSICFFLDSSELLDSSESTSSISFSMPFRSSSENARRGFITDSGKDDSLVLSISNGGHRSAKAISGLEQCAGGLSVMGAALYRGNIFSSAFSHRSAQHQSQSGVTSWMDFLLR